MNGDDNHDEHWELSYDEINVVHSLLSLKQPDIRPQLLFQRYKLHLICPQPYRKNLAASDAGVKQNRLLMAGGREWTKDFLNANEVARNGILIRVYDISGHEFHLLLKEKDDGKLYIIQIDEQATKWRDVCHAIGLQNGDFIKLWALRHDETSELCFVIEKY